MNSIIVHSPSRNERERICLNEMKRIIGLRLVVNAPNIKASAAIPHSNATLTAIQIQYSGRIIHLNSRRSFFTCTIAHSHSAISLGQSRQVT